MKNIFLVLVCFAFVHSSCQKCLHCIYTYEDSTGITQTVEVGERCGKEQDIKTLVDSCSKIVQNVGGTCTCTSK